MLNKIIKRLLSIKTGRKVPDLGWPITMFGHSSILVKKPNSLDSTKHFFQVEKEEIARDTWATIQTMTISRILLRFHTAYTYIRYFSYYQYVSEELEYFQNNNDIEIVPTKDRQAHFYLISECKEQEMFTKLFELGTSEHGGITLFALDYKPANRKELAERFFGIVNELRTKEACDFKNELEHCKLFCYSADDDLYIAKVDLPEDDVLLILNEIAHANELSLKIIKQS
jgi:hypothetical protein